MPDVNIAPENQKEELDVSKEIDEYRKNGIFRAMGDAAPFSLASATGHPLGLIILGSGDIRIQWIPPKCDLFESADTNNPPVLLVQRGNTQSQAYHFEPLVATSEDNIIALDEMYRKWLEKETSLSVPSNHGCLQPKNFDGIQSSNT